MISSQKDQTTKWPAVPDFQLAYLTAQFQQIKAQAYTGAVLIAVHHPPFSYSPPPKTGGAGGNHGGNSQMFWQIDPYAKHKAFIRMPFSPGTRTITSGTHALSSLEEASTPFPSLFAETAVTT